MGFRERMAAQVREAAVILARYDRPPVDHNGHVWPDVLPAVPAPHHHVPGWHSTPPSLPGTYRWRMTSAWEEVERELGGDGMVWSHRFLNFVPALKVGGEWFY